MPSKKSKTGAATRKPFKVLTRKAMIGWLAGIFVAFGWMFALGVLVGREQAPVEFDLNALAKKIERLRQKESVTSAKGSQKTAAAPGDKKQLEFYEALPENREDTDIPARPGKSREDGKQKPATAKEPPPTASGSERSPEKGTRQPASGKKAEAANSGTAARKGAYTIQAASVRSRPDAERLAGKLLKRGFPAFVLTSEIKGKGTWHRVRIGSYATREKAGPVLDKLRRAGMKPILVLQK